MRVAVEITREGRHLFVAFRDARGRGVTLRTRDRGGAALCALLGQSAGKHAWRAYQASIEGDLTVCESRESPESTKKQG